LVKFGSGKTGGTLLDGAHESLRKGKSGALIRLELDGGQAINGQAAPGTRHGQQSGGQRIDSTSAWERCQIESFHITDP
jgi:hypothetical protein